MRLFYSFILFFLLQINSFAQSYNSSINDLISVVNIDTLAKYVNDLSGENSVIINGESKTIVHRIDNLGNDIAADYILETLQKNGLSVENNVYSNKGRNIIAVQAGTVHPEIFYIICAHYDAVPNHGADDNASGTAAVLETARILSKHEFPYSIIYALWDQEEIGLIGSGNWANNARDLNININGVINLDMIGYNITQDHQFDIHTNATANSVNLANYISQFCSTYNLSLSPTIYNPGNPQSDHTSFWDNNYSALMLIEPLTTGLLNPHYHTDQDRINLFNMNFFHEMSKLGLGSIAGLASGEQLTATEDLISNDFSLKIYPNPTNCNSIIDLSMAKASFIKIDIISITGITLKTIENQFLAEGKYKFNLSDLNLSSGIYFIRLDTDFGSIYEKLIILK